MEQSSPDSKDVELHVDSVEYRSDGTHVHGLIAAPESMPADEVRRIMGEKIEASGGREISVRTWDTGGQSSRRSYGFSDWGGCSWEPEGPKGRKAEAPDADPNLN
jgi:hypothetical protein